MALKADKIIRSRRKSIAFCVNENAEIIVRAPFLVPKFFIENLLEKRKKWIFEQKEKRAQAPKRNFENGEVFLFLGEEFILEKGDFSHISFLEKKFFLPEKFQNPEEKLEKFYRASAKNILSERVDFFAKKNNLQPEKIRITGAKTRWGSCSAKNSLNFSWRLVLAPMLVIDSVVAHELAHIVHKNHSQKFWNFVAEIYPDHKKGHDWLKKNGHLLKI